MYCRTVIEISLTGSRTGAVSQPDIIGAEGFLLSHHSRRNRHVLATKRKRALTLEVDAEKRYLKKATFEKQVIAGSAVCFLRPVQGGNFQ